MTLAVAGWAAAAVLSSVAGRAADTPPPDPLRAEIEEVVAQLRSDDRPSRAYAALAVQRIARERWDFTLFDRPELRPWQRQIAPAAPLLVELLADDAILQWVSADDQPIAENATTPRREATIALLAIERAAVEPLIAALDGPVAAPADEVLRRLTRGGPAERTRAAWQVWWRDNAGRPLTNEQGRAWLIIALVVAVALAVGLTLWRARRRERLEPARPALGLRPPA